MGATFVGVDIIYVGVNVLSVRGVVGHRNFNRNSLNLAFHVHRLWNEAFAVLVDELREFLQAALAVKLLGTGASVLLNVALVGQLNADSAVQVGQLAKARCENVVLVDALVKNAGIRLKVYNGTAVV